MLGMAQKLFAERSLRSLAADVNLDARWPLLEKMLVGKCLGYVDMALAHHILGVHGDESIASLVCHLSLSSRSGHVCVKIEDQTILPSPLEIWVAEEVSGSKEIISSVDYEELHRLILEGARKITSPVLYEVGNPFSIAPIYRNGNSFYLQRYWSLETTFLNSFQQHFADDQALFSFDVEGVEKKIDEFLKQQKLLLEQAEAVLKAATSPLTLITGGPGTGKTYTAGILLCTLWESLPSDKKADFKMALAAPTGKAASNLEGSIQKALSGVEGFPLVKAQTLHQLLGIKKNGGIKKAAMLTADLILVDESSMIDLDMMGQLLSSIKPGARLVLLGDKHQLPSVEAGSVFADLVDHFLSSSSRSSQVVELKTCLRAELKGIVDLASSIKVGDYEAVLKHFETGQEGTLLVNLEDGVKEQQKQLLNYVIPHFPVVTKLPDDPLELLKLFSKFRILTPMRKGLLGADALNTLIFQVMREKMGHTGCCIVPIMVMQNDYRQHLFNGEVGLLVKDQGVEFALFASRELDKKARQIPLLMMPPFEYAYCLSVHKSQGSEFDHVVLVLPEGTQTFGREALYTGVTRAKRRLEIWSGQEVLVKMMNHVGLRQSGIIERLST